MNSKALFTLSLIFLFAACSKKTEQPKPKTHETPKATPTPSTPSRPMPIVLSDPPMLAINVPPEGIESMLIFIDPGHGGTDEGCSVISFDGKKIIEKEYAYDVACRLARAL